MDRDSRTVPLSRPVPAEPPVYDHAAGHVSERRPRWLPGMLDAAFVAVGAGLSLWLAVLYLREGFSLEPGRLLYLLAFWVLLTYIGLPRLHQILTVLYLPDYFIGRTRTTEGVLSDPLNLAVDGCEEDLHCAMRRAGWVLADERTLGSARRLVAATLLRRSYAAAPVSDLYLMGRRHDFTYQQEVGGTTSQRHHVRFWRLPEGFVLPGGHRADWIAAGTFDRALGFSLFTFQVTHRIDEDIDVERDYIVDTLRYADPQLPVAVIEDFSASFHHRNGQGDRLRTDGDLLVVDVRGARERSDGATAVMLPRNRPTGISVLRSRALESRGVGRQIASLARPPARHAPTTGIPERSAGMGGAMGDAGGGGAAGGGAAVGGARRGGSHRAEIAGQLQDAVGDIQDAFENVADHHLPPPTILLTAGLLLVQAGIVLWQWIDVARGRDPVVLIQDATALVTAHASLWQPTLVSALSLVLLVGVLRRSSWARIALMSVFTADAVIRLIGATGLMRQSGEHGALALAGVSVLGVMAITSDAARAWVLTRREGGARAVRGAGRRPGRGSSDEDAATDAAAAEVRVGHPGANR